DTDSDATGRAAHPGPVIEQQMEAAAARRMSTCLRETVGIEVPPQACCKMLDIDIDDIEAGDYSRSDPNQLSRVKLPQVEQCSRIFSRIMKPMRRCRRLVQSAEEYLEALASEFQGVIERAHC